MGAIARAQVDPDQSPPPPPPPPPVSAAGTGTAQPSAGAEADSVMVLPVDQHAADKISGRAFLPRFCLHDPGLNRLLIGGASTGSGGGLISVSLDHGTVKTLPIGNVVALAVDPEDNKIFIALTDQSQIEVLDRKSLQRIDSIVLNDPAATLDYDARDHLLIAGAARQALAWIIDARQHVLLDSVVLSGAPSASVFDVAASRDYLCIPSANSVDVVDPVTRAVASLWQLQPGMSPWTASLSGAQHVFVAADAIGKVATLDAGTGRVSGVAIVAGGTSGLYVDDSSARVVTVAGAVGAASVYVVSPQAPPILIGSFAAPMGVSAGTMISARQGGDDLYLVYSNASGTYLQLFTLPAL